MKTPQPLPDYPDKFTIQNTLAMMFAQARESSGENGISSGFRVYNQTHTSVDVSHFEPAEEFSGKREEEMLLKYQNLLSKHYNVEHRGSYLRITQKVTVLGTG